MYEVRLKSSEPDQEAGAAEPRNLICIKSKHLLDFFTVIHPIYLH